MPYMQSGLTRLQGDPGFFSFVGKALGTVARFIPGPVGAVAGALLGPRKSPSVGTPGFVGPVQSPPLRTGGSAKTGAATVATVSADGTVCPVKRRRRIDPLNIKALRRANTRQRSFLRAVDRTLKTMPTRASVTKRRQKLSGVTRKSGGS